MPPIPRRSTGIVLALCCLLLLGVMPLISAHRPAGSDGLTFALALTLWQLLFALPLFLAERRQIRPARAAPGRRTLAIALLTGLMFGISTLMYVVAADRAGPVDMAIALQAYPFIAMAMEALILRKPRSRREIACALIMAAALVWLITGGNLSAAHISVWVVFTLGVPVLWSAAHLMLKQVLTTTTVTPSEVTVTRLVISGALLLVLAALFGEPGALIRALGDPGFQMAAAAMGLAYYLELILWFNAIRHIDVSLGSSLTVPAPAVTMGVSALLLATPVAPYQIASMAVITAALYGLIFGSRGK